MNKLIYYKIHVLISQIHIFRTPECGKYGTLFGSEFPSFRVSEHQKNVGLNLPDVVIDSHDCLGAAFLRHCR